MKEILFRVTKTLQAELDLNEIWYHIGLENINAADVLLDAIDSRCRLLHGARDLWEAFHDV